MVGPSGSFDASKLFVESVVVDNNGFVLLLGRRIGWLWLIVEIVVVIAGLLFLIGLRMPCWAVFTWGGLGRVDRGVVIGRLIRLECSWVGNWFIRERTFWIIDWYSSKFAVDTGRVVIDYCQRLGDCRCGGGIERSCECIRTREWGRERKKGESVCRRGHRVSSFAEVF